jgi:hypothetical protein
MSQRELQDIEFEAKEQQEQADEFNREIEQHKSSIGRLEKALQEIKASSQELASDELRHAEIETKKAWAETESRLDEIMREKERLLQDNERMAQTVLKANEGRRQAMQEVVIAQTVEQGGKIAGMIEGIYDTLRLDQGKLAKAEGDLEEARRRLEALDV